MTGILDDLRAVDDVSAVTAADELQICNDGAADLATTTFFDQKPDALVLDVELR